MYAEMLLGCWGQLGDSRAVGPLITSLQDRHSEVRNIVVRALGQLGDSQAISPLIALLQDELFEMRQKAATALGQLGWQPDRSEAAAFYYIATGQWEQCVPLEGQAVDPLIACLQYRDFARRQAAATALLKIYRVAGLDGVQKRRILAQRTTITRGH